MTQAFLVDYLALSSRILLNIFGPIATLLIVQSKGWYVYPAFLRESPAFPFLCLETQPMTFVRTKAFYIVLLGYVGLCPIAGR